MAKVLHGDATANQINAGSDKTQVYGLAGNDTLTSDNKSDVLLVGGSGDDSLIVTGGTATLSGGDGSDTFELTYSANKKISAVIEDFDPSTDKIIVNFDGETVPQLSSSISGNDVILSDSDGYFNVTIKAVRDNDYFDGDATDEIWQVLWLTNAEREKQNLPALTLADGLTAGASIRAQEITDLGQDGVLSNHYRPDGSPYYSVLDDKYNFPGENLDGGARSPAQVLHDWMNSDSHKENILRDNFQKLGVGYNYFDADPTDHRFYWVQLFADNLNAQDTVDVSAATPTVSKFVELNDDSNVYENSAYGATINAKGGGDQITNDGLLASISGGNDDDTINNTGSFTTINAGAGNDQINLNNSKENVIEYNLGDGADTISGLNPTDIVSISGDEFTPAIVDNDIVVAVGADSITLKDAAIGGVQLIGERSKYIILTEDSDQFENTVDDATIDARGGDDHIYNYGSNVMIDGSDGGDSIDNSGSDVLIDSGDGVDYIVNHNSNVIINSGAGNDSVDNLSANVTINSGSGEDYIFNSGQNVSINSAAGNDTIFNTSLGAGVTMNGGAGNDYISNYSESVTIDAGDGNDYISNQGENVSINGNDGNDNIHNVASFVTIESGAGNDSIANLASFVTIDGGAYNDFITNNNVTDVSIAGGSGNDTINNSIGGSNVTIDGGTGEDFIVNTGSNVTINAGAHARRLKIICSFTIPATATTLLPASTPQPLLESATAPAPILRKPAAIMLS